MGKYFSSRLILGLAVSMVGSPVMSQERFSDPVQVLIVTAHPDDDAAFSGVVYQITHQLGGAVDLALVTDGSGGFRYSTLAEKIYGLEITNEAVARQHLPAIRKQELMAGGAIVGIRNYFFLDQLDDAFSTDPQPALTTIWNADFVRKRLAELMRKGSYDLVFVALPFVQMHGHHKAATILALEAVELLPPSRRPVVLGGFLCAVGNQPIRFEGLDGYAMTAVGLGQPLVEFDRTQKFGFNDRLDFRIIANWVIAEHKSQGAMQLNMNRGDAECYWFFDINDVTRKTAVSDLFSRLTVRER